MEKLINNLKSLNLGILALVFTCLFITGLSFVISFSKGAPHYPGPWETMENISFYFRNNPQNVMLCSFFQFAAAILLGLLTAGLVSRLKFHGTNPSATFTALFAGFMTSFNLSVSSLVLWVMSQEAIAQDATINYALYHIVFAVGGVGYSVPLGLLIAGISIASFSLDLLPRWFLIFGLLLAVIGVFSMLSLVLPKLLPLIPLTRFPGFIWLIMAGFRLSRSANY